MSISAPHSGKVTELGVKDGDSVDSQDLICKIGKGGEEDGESKEKEQANGKAEANGKKEDGAKEEKKE